MRDNERWRPTSRLPHKKLQDFTDFAIINWPPYIAYYNEKALSDHTSMESMQLYSGQMICVPIDDNFTLGMVFFRVQNTKKTNGWLRVCRLAIRGT